MEHLTNFIIFLSYIDKNKKIMAIDENVEDNINAYRGSLSFNDIKHNKFQNMFSLKGVLEPFSSNENIKFLQRAGFKDISIISKDLCFEGILAIK